MGRDRAGGRESAGGDRLDVGFVPAEVPGAGLSGAVETSTLLVEHLSRRHDLTVYVTSPHEAPEDGLPAADRVDYVRNDGLGKLPHPITTKQRALRGEVEALERHDLVHAYASPFVPLLADLSVPTVATLNSYAPVCPKGDMRYHGRHSCAGPGLAKCLGCIGATAARRRQGLEDEARSAYDALRRVALVRRSMASGGDVDAYHVLAPHLASDYAALGFPEDRMQVVSHFYDESFLRPPDPVARRPFTLLSVGALERFKGVQVLLRAVAELRRRGRDVRLEVAGEGPYGDRLRALAADLGLGDAVEWLGYVDHAALPDRYAAADAFVYPGLIEEPFGRVLLESLAAGTPVVASDVGSTGHVVGAAGERFPPGDAGALADAVERLVADYAARVASVPTERARFAPESVLDRLDDLYRTVADRPPSGLSAP